MLLTLEIRLLYPQEYKKNAIKSEAERVRQEFIKEYSKLLRDESFPLTDGGSRPQNNGMVETKFTTKIRVRNNKGQEALDTFCDFKLLTRKKTLK